MAALKDAKQNLSFHTDKFARALTAATAAVRDSKAALQMSQVQGEELILATAERYERAQMRVEELLTRLCETCKQTQVARSSARQQSSLIAALERERVKEQRQDEMIEICLMLLNDSLEFFEKNQERSAVIVTST